VVRILTYGLWFLRQSEGRIREEFESYLLSLSFSPNLCKRVHVAMRLCKDKQYKIINAKQKVKVFAVF